MTTQESKEHLLRNSNTKTKRRGDRDVDELSDFGTNTSSSQCEARLYIFEDSEAVIKIIKGRSATMRHVSRTRRDALDWLFDRINLDTKI